MILEYRIPLPINTEDFQVGQLYMVIKAQEAATGGGEGVLVLKNEPYAPPSRPPHCVASIIAMDIRANPTSLAFRSPNSRASTPSSSMCRSPPPSTSYLLASKVPGVVKALIKPENLIIIEEAWNAHPYCLTVWTCPALSKEKFSISIESRYFDDYVCRVPPRSFVGRSGERHGPEPQRPQEERGHLHGYRRQL